MNLKNFKTFEQFTVSNLIKLIKNPMISLIYEERNNKNKEKNIMQKSPPLSKFSGLSDADRLHTSKVWALKLRLCVNP